VEPKARPPFRRVAIAAIGAGLGILIMVALAEWAGLSLAAVPFVTSIVLVMAAPETAFAQPRNLIGGHLLCAAAGFVVLFAGGHDPWFAALAIALGVAAMQLTGTMHPPAGINAFLVVVNKTAWTFFIMPVAVGAFLLAIFAYTYHRLTMPGAWPASGRR
jgi:CBS-domain-containing membrane protein